MHHDDEDDCKYAAVGYWLEALEGGSSKLIECPNQDKSCKGRNECRAGYTGYLCAICSDGFFQSAGGECSECPEEKYNWFPPLIFFLSLVTISLVLMLNLKGFRSYLVNVLKKRTPKKVKIFFETLKSHQKSLRSKTKILISFAQVTLLVRSVYSIPYPNIFQEFTRDIWNFFGLQIVFETECYTRISFLMKFLSMAGTPLALVAITLAVSYVSSLTTNKAEKKRKRIAQGHSTAIWVAFTFLPSASFASFQCFICNENTNTLKADPMIICDSEIDDEYRLIQAVGAIGVLIWPIGTPLVCLFLLWRHFGPSRREFYGMIKHIATGSALVESKQEATFVERGKNLETVGQHLKTMMRQQEEEQLRLLNLEKTAPAYLHPLNGEFEPQCWYIPILELYAKLWVTGGVLLFGEKVVDQLVSSMLVNLFSLLICFSTQPFKDFNDDLFSMFSYLQVFLLLLWSLLVHFENIVESEQKALESVLNELSITSGSYKRGEEEYFGKFGDSLGYLLVFSCASVFLVYTFFVFVDVKQAAQTYRARRKWDEIKERMTEEHTEEDVLDQMGIQLGLSDKELILEKFRTRTVSMEGKGVGDIPEASSMEVNRRIKLAKLQSKKAMAEKRRSTHANIDWKRDMEESFSTQPGIEMSDLYGGGGSGDSNEEIKMRTNPLNKNYDGRDLRAVSSGEVGLGGDVISKYEKYKQKSKEKNASGNGAKKKENVSFEHTADEPANVRKIDGVSLP